MKYTVLYAFVSVLDSNIYLVEIKLNIITPNKSDKYFWLYINTDSNDIKRLEFVDMKHKDSHTVRIFNNSKLYLTNDNTIGLYDDHNHRAPYIGILNVPDMVNTLVDSYFPN